MKLIKAWKSSFFPLCLSAVFGMLVIIHARASLDGMKSGLEMCAQIVIPSLFPFLVISSFAAKLEIPKRAYKIADKVMRFLFHLPADAVTCIIFGALGGFPVGCVTAAQLCKDGRINNEQAQRLTLFCINAGPAFTVTAVGTSMLGSTKGGAILFASLLLSSLTIGILLGFTAPKPEKAVKISGFEASASAAFVHSAEQGSKAIIRICAWVSLFSCFFSLLKETGISDSLMNVIKCFFEVTAGCKAAAETGNIYAVAATLGWSGLCVICQVLSDVRSVGTPLTVLLAFKALHAGLSTVFCRLFLYLFPIEVSVFSSFSGQASGEFFSASAPAAVALMCLCAVFVIDLDRNKKMC